VTELTVVAVPMPSGALTALPVTLSAPMSAEVAMPTGGVEGWGAMHTQDTPAASWHILVPPAFGRLPNVQIYLTTGEPVIVDFTATLTDVYVTFPNPTAGYAVLT